MSIFETDIKLLKSERLTDAEDGGGLVTGQVVTDGQVNNVFPDISQLDRTIGRVGMRKVFPAVQTGNAETYYGAHVILTQPPADPRVSVTLFSTASWTDERSDARNSVENYVVGATESRWRLYGDHIVGQRSLRLFGLADAPSPEAGEVYLLSTEKDGLPPDQQYVRITKMASRITQTFEDDKGVFTRDVVVLEISNPLRYHFYGIEVSRFSSTRANSLVRTTQVADAAHYYGAKPLTVAGQIGDLTVSVGSPYSAIVPSAQVETPLVDVQAGMGKAVYVPVGPAGSLTASISSGAQASPYTATLYAGMGMVPGSVRLTLSGGAGDLTDDGSGGLVPAVSGGAAGYSGTVDYGTGAMTVTGPTSWSRTVALTATPAAATTIMAHTEDVAITLQNRAYNYVRTLVPVPAPGTLTVDFRAMGKWVRLYDDGKGHLAGNANEGSGTIDYATGSVISTLGAYPDAGSSIIYSWGTATHYTVRAGDSAIDMPAISMQLAHGGVVPGSVSLSWPSGGQVKHAVDDSHGAISGDGSGRIVYSTGALSIIPLVTPDPSAVIDVSYRWGADTSATYTPAKAGNVVTVTLPDVPVRPGSVNITYTLDDESNPYVGQRGPYQVSIVDNGNGGLLRAPGGGVIDGTIDYSTGVIVFAPDINRVAGGSLFHPVVVTVGSA